MRATWTSCLPILLSWVPAALAVEEPAAKQPAAGVGWRLIGVFLVVAGLAALAFLGWLIRWFVLRRKLVAKNDPRQLLHELCRAHHLSRRAESLLRKAAAVLGTPHPARFFLEPKLLRQASTCEQLAGSKRALQLLQEELFGEEDC